MAWRHGVPAGWTEVVMDADYVAVPSGIARKASRNAELARVRRARYETTHTGRSRGGSGTPRVAQCDKEFIAWDGEGPRDTGYSLLGNSTGLELCYPSLRTVDCLELFIEAEHDYPDAIHFGFGFNYDVSNILTDLSWRHLSALRKYGRTIWRNWELQHIPHKWFRIKYGNTTITIFDVRSFFTGSLVRSLEDWNIGPFAKDALEDAESAMVRVFKGRRAEFLWSEIAEIAVYMRLELKYSVLLMEKLRRIFMDAGYLPSSWHGPGSLARMAMRRHKVYDAMVETPPEVQLAAQFAFAGGRFEEPLAGHVRGTVYSADQNSAYPYFATKLPDLSQGQWRRTRTYEPNKFGVYRIEYESKPDPYRLYPLFRRLQSGNVVWPYRTAGWYWSPEAELVSEDADASIIEGYVFDTATDHRPFDWITEYYRRRQLLKRAGNPAEFTFKTIINADYGQTAQRAGWDRKLKRAPKGHQLEFAGYITSGCRAESYRAAIACGDQVISIDTDGIYSMCPIPVTNTGSELGQWKLSEFDDGIFWQSGIYMLRKGDSWASGESKAKTRGIPSGSYTAEDLLKCYKEGEPLRLDKKVFVSYGLALGGQRDQLNTWRTEPHEYVFGGTGKRYHAPRSCTNSCFGDMHRLCMPSMLYGPYCDRESGRHYLPWLDTTESDLAETKHLIDDYTFYDQNHLDADDEWVRHYGA